MCHAGLGVCLIYLIPAANSVNTAHLGHSLLVRSSLVHARRRFRSVIRHFYTQTPVPALAPSNLQGDLTLSAQRKHLNVVPSVGDDDDATGVWPGSDAIPVQSAVEPVVGTAERPDGARIGQARAEVDARGGESTQSCDLFASPQEERVGMGARGVKEDGGETHGGRTSAVHSRWVQLETLSNCMGVTRDWLLSLKQQRLACSFLVLTVHSGLTL